MHGHVGWQDSNLGHNLSQSLGCRPRGGDAIAGAIPGFSGKQPLSVDTATVKRVARLARIAVSDAEAEAMRGPLNEILGFVEQLNEVDVTGVEPMTSVRPMPMKQREDIVTEGFRPEDIVANAPESEDDFFVVPKVVE